MSLLASKAACKITVTQWEHGGLVKVERSKRGVQHARHVTLHRIASCEHLGRWIVVIVLFQIAAFVDLAQTGQWQPPSPACSYSRGDRGLTSLQATGCLSTCGCSASGSGGSAAITLRRGPTGTLSKASLERDQIELGRSRPRSDQATCFWAGCK